jgi:hypothetical protein
VTNLEVTAVEFDSAESTALPENASLTKPLPREEVRQAISDVVARADENYALDLITVLQIKTRITEDTGERLTLNQFAELEGWGDELTQLRAE